MRYGYGDAQGHAREQGARQGQGQGQGANPGVIYCRGQFRDGTPCVNTLAVVTAGNVLQSWKKGRAWEIADGVVTCERCGNRRRIRGGRIVDAPAAEVTVMLPGKRFEVAV